MSKFDPFNFDISAKTDKQKRSAQRSKRGMSGAQEKSQRVCDKEGCEKRGQYRAPKSPKTPNEYYWFCQEHVREYNAEWNFFDNAGISFDEQSESDKAWNKDTKPFRERNAESKAWAHLGIQDPYAVLGDKATRQRDPQATTFRKLSPKERRAMAILGITEMKTKVDIRRVYKSLIKDLHPDRNDGSRADEERMAEVVWAWDQVKDSRNFLEK